MEDSLYFANILRSRECAVCGADRRGTTAPAAGACAVCRGPLDPSAVLLFVSQGGAQATCSDECLGVLLQERVAGGGGCPACGSPWSEAHPPPRTCRTCAKDLDFADGYVGLWQSGRLVPFCGPACLAMHRDRVNPFCG